jgi:hypothetical protein
MRSIILAGKHSEAGEVYECPTHLAQQLVGEGSAEYHEDSADEADKENKLGLTVHSPRNDDPQPRRISSAPKPKAKAEDDEEPGKPKAKSGS